MQDDELQKILDSLKIIEKLYEKVRLVDPIKNEVLCYRNHAVIHLNTKCFDLWDKNEACSNCICKRALDENQTFVKLEYFLTEIYMVMAVPIELGGRFVVLELVKNITHSLIVEGEHMEASADVQLSLEKMRNLTIKDALTDIFNRRYIDEKLPSDISHALLTQQSLSIIMADIDLFKNVNDTYGHLAGDEVLKTFAQTLCSNLRRDADWAARYGGEEFIICLPGAKQKNAIELAEVMRKSVEETVIEYGSNSIKITASFGVCSIDCVEDKSKNGMIEYADKKLYLAKQSGRNRVES